MNELNFEDFKHELFSVPIWGFVVNSHTHQSFDYIDTLLRLEKTTPSAIKSNSMGFQTSDTLYENGVFRELIDVLNLHASHAFNSYMKRNVRLEISEMWGNINNKYCFNHTHSHSGALSGVLYLEVPENSGNIVFINSSLLSRGNVLSQKNYSVKPQKLLCLFFPSWLEHYVEPNLSEDKRISLSFNFNIVSE